jgi:hypothetical protein
VLLTHTGPGFIYPVATVDEQPFLLPRTATVLTLVSDLRCVMLHSRAAGSYMATAYFLGPRDS